MREGASTPQNTDIRTQVRLRDLLHLDEDHRTNFFGGEGLFFAAVLDVDRRLAADAARDLEGPVLHVALDGAVGELSSNKSFGVEDRVEGVHGDLILGGIANEALRLVEGDVRRRRSVTLVVRDDLDPIVLPHSYTTVGRAQVDAHTFSRDVGHGCSFSCLRLRDAFENGTFGLWGCVGALWLCKRLAG